MRILVVEDDERVGDVIARALRSDGHQVSVAATRAKGARGARGARSFELAIIDIGLPDGSGLDLCREARAGGSDLPILVLTARTGVDDRVHGLDAGADDYLGKALRHRRAHRARPRARAARSYDGPKGSASTARCRSSASDGA